MRAPLRPLLGLAAAAGLVACGSGTGEPGHGLLLIAIEGLRADHLSTYGYDRATMPGLEGLAQDGFVFERTIAASPLRVPSHAALLTGSDPNLARRRVPQWVEASLDQIWNIPAELPRLATELAVAGYRTAAFVDHAELAGGFGFDRGFQTYEQVWDLDDRDERGIEYTSFRLQQWLRDVDRDEDWFAFVHVGDLERVWTSADALRDTYFEPRPGPTRIPPLGSSDPCLFAIPPSRWLGGSFTLAQYAARYDGALRALDAELVQLWRQLESDRRFADTTICVVGSFGVQFGEAGLVLDHGRLSAADLHVPWILRPAGDRGLAGGRRVATMASLTDVAPTLLDVCGLGVPVRMTGVTQGPALRGEGVEPRQVAFASCAIQGGYAAFDRERALEVIFPAEAHPRLVEAWFGYPHEGPAPAVELGYRWLDEPYPPFHTHAGRDPEFDRLRSAGATRIDYVESVRAELHEPLPFFLPDAGEGSP